jgi:hypothetical protein
MHMSSAPTFRLFKERRPFVDGLSSVFDYTPLADAYHQSVTPAQADAEALAADFLATGNDLRSALNDYGYGGKR